MATKKAKTENKGRKRGPKVGIFGKKKWVGISISVGLLDKLRDMARDQNISASAWIERAIMHNYRVQRAMSYRERVKFGHTEDERTSPQFEDEETEQNDE